MGNKGMERGDAYLQLSFKCDKRLWAYWARILPQVGYPEFNLTTEVLIDDAVSFACYCLDEFEDFPDEPAAYNFRSSLWDAMTGFAKLSSFTHEVSERVDEQLRNRRVQQLYLEHCVRRKMNGELAEELPAGDYWTKRSRIREFSSFPSYEGVSRIPNPLCSHLSLENLRESISQALIFGYLGSEDVTILLTRDTSTALSEYLNRFEIPAKEAVRIVLIMTQRFMLLNGTFSNSFRADLLDRYLACKTFVLRWLDQLAIFESLSIESDEYSRILVDRLSVLNKKLKSGQSLQDYMADNSDSGEAKGEIEPLKPSLDRYESLGGGML